mmetsp:Transcript_16708/g.28338  ORF Transcript_16708/g.28338 Transcript_16708/m.28338 type:complete len:112 (+) Transcript_16708:79-414(+)
MTTFNDERVADGRCRVVNWFQVEGNANILYSALVASFCTSRVPSSMFILVMRIPGTQWPLTPVVRPHCYSAHGWHDCQRRLDVMILLPLVLACIRHRQAIVGDVYFFIVHR